MKEHLRRYHYLYLAGACLLASLVQILMVGSIHGAVWAMISAIIALSAHAEREAIYFLHMVLEAFINIKRNGTTDSDSPDPSLSEPAASEEG